MGASIHSLHANFNGGEMTPLMLSRFDTDKLRSGCKTMKNFIVRPYGGVFKRPGTQYAGRVKASADSTRIIPFRRSTSTNYVLELGDFYMRFWKGGTTPSQVTVSGVVAWASATSYVVGDIRSNGGTNYYCKTAHTSGGSFSGTNWYALTGSVFEIPTPWAKADIFALQFTQINDVMFFTHPNYLPYRFSRFAETNCVLELVPFTFAPSLDVNTTRAAAQVQYNIPAWSNSVTSQAVGDRVLGVTAPWVNEVFTCVAAHNPSITANDEPGVGSSYKSYWALGTSSVLAADWLTATAYSAGDKKRNNLVVYECTASHTSGTASEPGKGSSWSSFWKISTGDYDQGTLTYNLVSTEAAFSASDVGNTWEVEIGATSYNRQFTLNSSPLLSKGIFVQGDMLVSTNWASGQGPIGLLYLEASNDRSTWQRVREWNITTQGDNNIAHTETAPDTGAYYRIGAVLTVNSIYSFKIEPVTNSITVPFVITGYTSSTLVTGYAKLPGNQRIPLEAVGVSTTLYRKPAFSSTSGYPRSVAFHSGRLWFAGTSSNPGRIWASSSDDYYTFLHGTLDTSSLDVTLGASESNEIRWMKSRGKILVIGTTGEEWTIDSGDTNVVLTPTNIRAVRQTNKGSNGLPAELISDALLMVARGGRNVHEFAYQFANDQYVAPDMNVLAEHITQGGIVQMAYQSTPDPILWCIISNGSLAGFSYSREQQITAWHRHTTGDDAGDAFESVATIYGAGVSDEVWFVVKRTIGGVTVRNIERFDPAVFQWNTEQNGTMDGKTWLDCASTGVLASTVVNSGGNCTISGFTSLNGRSVRMLAGTASNASAAVVSAGAATFTGFTATGTTPVIGLPILSTLQSMPLDLALQDGTAQGRHWRPNRCQFILNQCLGGQFADSPSSSQIDNIEYPDGTTSPFTGRIRHHIPASWEDEVSFAILHNDPYPFGMLAYVLISEVSGS